MLQQSVTCYDEIKTIYCKVTSQSTSVHLIMCYFDCAISVEAALLLQRFFEKLFWLVSSDT